MIEVAGTTKDSMNGNSVVAGDPATLVAEVEALGERLHRVRESVGRVIFGQQDVVEHTLITLLSGGHALLVGVPGLGVPASGLAAGTAAPRCGPSAGLIPFCTPASPFTALSAPPLAIGLPIHMSHTSG